MQTLLDQRRISRDTVSNMPVMQGLGMHLLPEMNDIITVKGRANHDLVHLATQTNRRFALIKEPQRDTRGFILEIKRLNPSFVRGESLVEVVGKERFIADVVQVPADRQGLYASEAEALKFANGRVIKDCLI